MMRRPFRSQSFVRIGRRLRSPLPPSFLTIGGNGGIGRYAARAHASSITLQRAPRFSSSTCSSFFFDNHSERHRRCQQRQQLFLQPRRDLFSVSHPGGNSIPVSVSARSQTQSRQLSTTPKVPKYFNHDHLSSTKILYAKQDADLSDDEMELKQLLAAADDMIQESTSLSLNSDGNDDDDTKRHREEYSNILTDLSTVYHALEGWDEALMVEQINSSHYLSDRSDEYADSIHRQGKLTLRLGKIVAARRLYEQALPHYQSKDDDDVAGVNDSVQIGHIQMSLAGCFYFQDDLSQALQLLKDSEPKLEANPILLMKNLDNQGLIYREMDDYDTALERYQQALQVLIGGSITDTFDFNVTLEQVPKEHHAQIQNLRLHIADMTAACNDPETAIDLYMALYESVDDLALEGVLLHNMAELHVRIDQPMVALDHYRLAIQCKQQSALMAARGENVQNPAGDAATNATSASVVTDGIIEWEKTASPELVKSLVGMGALQARMDQASEAMESWRHALLMARIVAGNDVAHDPQVLNLMQSIAALEKQQRMSKEEKKEGQ